MIMVDKAAVEPPSGPKGIVAVVAVVAIPELVVVQMSSNRFFSC